MVYGRGSVTYGVAKVLAKVLKPMVGKSPIRYKVLGTLLTRSKG